jgi:hypothetical protein
LAAAPPLTHVVGKLQNNHFPYVIPQIEHNELYINQNQSHRHGKLALIKCLCNNEINEITVIDDDRDPQKKTEGKFVLAID